MPTAIVIDGAYFLRRFHHSFPDLNAVDAADIAIGVVSMAAFHVATRLQADPVWDGMLPNRFRPEESPSLYRIFFYDCAPLTKRVHRPVSKQSLNLAKSEEAVLRLAIHEKLRCTRKVALRLGTLNDGLSGWKPKPQAVERWLANPTTFLPTDDDFQIDVVQKGVDMRLGLDIASMAYKRQVDQIVMVTADADFLPVAKLARREGIDVVLDPMHGPTSQSLAEHVDGIRNCFIGRRP